MKPLKEFIEFNDDERPQRCIIFIVPSQDNVVHLAEAHGEDDDDEDSFFCKDVAYPASVRPDLARDKKVTLSKRQKETLKVGADSVGKQDAVMWSSLANRVPSLRKIMLMVSVMASAFVPAAGHVSEFLDPGLNGTHCNKELFKNMQNIIDKNDPTLVYVHVPFGDDELNDNAGTCQLKANIDKLATKTDALLLQTRSTRLVGMSVDTSR